MRVRFLKDWQGESPASFKKDDVTEIDDNLAWDLALQNVVKFLRPIDLELEAAKKANKKRSDNVPMG